MNNGFNQGVTPNMNQPMGNTNNGTNFINNIPKDKVSIIGYAGALVAVIACFLKFVIATATVYGYSASSSFSYASTGDGKIFIILMIGCAVLIALKKHAHAALAAGPAALLFIYDLITVKNKIGDYQSSYIKISFGPGMWIAAIGIVAIGVSVYLYWKANPDCFKTLFKKNNAPAPQPIMGGYQQPVQNQPMNNYSAPQVPQQPVQPVQPVPPVGQPTQVGQMEPMNNMTQVPQQPMNNGVDQNNQFYNGQ